MTNKKIVFFFLLPVLLSFILHFRVLNLDLIGYHVWRQSQTQTVIYNFTFSDNSIFHPQKFDLSNGTSALMYEFPLYQWIIAQVNNVFGYSVLHTRVVTFLIFILILMGFNRLLIKFVSKEIALISNALLCFSPLLYYYCINPLPDILALCFAVWSLNFFFSFIFSNRIPYFFLFSIFLMLSALVKLPFVIFGSVFALYIYKLVIKKSYKEVFAKSAIFFFCLIPVAAWYYIAIPTWRDKGVVMGLWNSSKTLIHLLDCFQFNLISTVPELITNYAACIFLVTGIYLFFKRIKFNKTQHGYLIILFVAASAYFLFELNMIEKAHDYYLLPFVPLIFLVVTYGVKYFYESKYKKFVYIIVCIVPLTAWLRIDTRWRLDTPGFATDYMTKQNVLQSIIPANEQCIIDSDDSHFIALYYLKRRGYSLFEKEISTAVLTDRYQKGAHFLVTENLSINLSAYPDFNFEELSQGFSIKNLKVYKLSLK